MTDDAVTRLREAFLAGGREAIERDPELKALLASHGSLDYARRTADEFVATAKQALSVFPASAEREALLYLPDYVVSRDR